MLITFSVLVLMLSVLATALYYFFPGILFNSSIKLGRWKAGLIKKNIVIGDQTIAYLTGGKGEPLLLLHGFGADKDNWTLIAPYLVAKYQLIIPDLAGFGESPFLEGKTYSPTEQVDLLIGFVRQLGVHKLHVGGNSMGGYLAAKFAQKVGSDVQSVWLLAPAGVTTEKNADGISLIESGDNPLIIHTESDFDRLIRLCFEVPPSTPKAIKSFLFKKARDRAVVNSRLFSDLIGGQTIPEENPLKLEDSIEKIESNIFLVWGDSDRILHVDGLQVLEEKLANANRRHESVMMNNMGHIPMIERPEDTATDFLNFSQRMH